MENRSGITVTDAAIRAYIWLMLREVESGKLVIVFDQTRSNGYGKRHNKRSAFVEI